MSSAIEIDPEIKNLETQIAELQAKKLATISLKKAFVIEQIKLAVAAYGITAADLGLSASGAGGTRKPRAKSDTSWPVKSKTEVITYKHPVTGKTWVSTTKGPIPAWINEAFAAGNEKDIIASRVPA